MNNKEELININNEIESITNKILTIKKETRSLLEQESSDKTRTKIYENYKKKISEFKNDKNLHKYYNKLKKRQPQLLTVLSSKNIDNLSKSFNTESSKTRLLHNLKKTYNTSTNSFKNKLVNKYLVSNNTSATCSGNNVDSCDDNTTTCDDNNTTTCDDNNTTTCDDTESCTNDSNCMITLELTTADQESLKKYYAYLCSLRNILSA